MSSGEDGLHLGRRSVLFGVSGLSIATAGASERFVAIRGAKQGGLIGSPDHEASIYPSDAKLTPGSRYSIVVAVRVASPTFDFSDELPDPELHVELEGATVKDEFSGEGYDDAEVIGDEKEVEFSADAFDPRAHHAVTVVIEPDGSGPVTVTATPSDGDGGERDPVSVVYGLDDAELSTDVFADAAVQRAELCSQYSANYDLTVDDTPVEDDVVEATVDVLTQIGVDKSKSLALSGLDDFTELSVEWVRSGFTAYGLMRGLENTTVGQTMQTVTNLADDFVDHTHDEAVRCAGEADRFLGDLEGLCEDEATYWEDGDRDALIDVLEEQLDVVHDRGENDRGSSVRYEARNQRNYLRNSNRLCDGYTITANWTHQKELQDFFDSLVEFSRDERDVIEDTLRYARPPSPSVSTETHESKIGLELRELADGDRDEVDITFDVSNSSDGGITGEEGFLSFTYSDVLDVSTVETDDDIEFDEEQLEVGEEAFDDQGDEITLEDPLQDIWRQYQPGETATFVVQFRIDDDTDASEIDDEDLWINYRAAFEPILTQKEGVEENDAIERGFARAPADGNGDKRDTQQGWNIYRISAADDAPTRPRARFDLKGPIDESEPVTLDGSDSTADGDIVSYEWEIDTDLDGEFDRTENGQSVEDVTFSGDGTAKVRLIVEDNSGQTDSLERTVTVKGLDPLAASFRTEPSRPKPDESVTFVAAELDGDVDYEWEINGSSETGREVIHTFSESGEYEIELTVSRGSEKDETTTEVTVKSLEEIFGEPRARFDGPTELEPGEEGTWDASASYHPSERDDTDEDVVEIVDFEWVFDGETNTETGTTASTAFDEEGEYLVELLVTDENGLTDTASQAGTVVDDRGADNGNDDDGDEEDNDEPDTGDVEERWVVESDAVTSSPTIVDDTVYVQANGMTAIDADSGEELWNIDLSTVTTPTVIDGTAYFGTENYLFAVDTATGNELWRLETEFDFVGAPAVTNGRIYVSAFDIENRAVAKSDILAIDADTGGELWRVRDTGRGNTPTVAEGSVYIGNGHHLYALDADTGNKQWQFDTGGSIGSSSPTVVDGTVFIGGNGENIYALDGDTGDERWKFETDGWIWSSPTVANGTVFVGSRDNRVYALDKDTGEQVWTFATNDVVESSPTVADTTVFIGSDDGRLYALDAEDGDERWSFESDGPIKSAPTVVDGTVYFVSQDAYVYALKTGVTESSTDSRVNLGTLGHHHKWADQEWDRSDEPVVVVGNELPRDLNGDGRYEDINGDGSADILDVQALHQNLDREAVQNHSGAYNFSGEDTDEVTEADVQALYEMVSEGEDNA